MSDPLYDQMLSENAQVKRLKSVLSKVQSAIDEIELSHPEQKESIASLRAVVDDVFNERMAVCLIQPHAARIADLFENILTDALSGANVKPFINKKTLASTVSLSYNKKQEQTTTYNERAQTTSENV
ncbi:MAG: hypothetical protein R3D58_13735 [Saprospiraceae bacterium]